VKIVFNSSPLIFLSRLGFLEIFLNSDTADFFLPEIVQEEIRAKTDEACQQVIHFISINKITIKSINLGSLANSLNQRLGRGESEAIALAIELSSDYIILDDFAARKEARRLGLNVKGTLAIIKKLQADQKIEIASLEQLYQELVAINFRVKKELFDSIFQD
jgi:predicted nucleic acid-binding protein